MSKIVVTGGLGFIGSSVVKKLLSAGHHVLIVDRLEQVVRRLEESRSSFPSNPLISLVYENLSRCQTFSPDEIDSWSFDVLDGTGCVIHLGASVDTIFKSETLDELFYNNLHFTRKLVDHLSTNESTSMVFASSAAVYGNDGFPNNPYGLTKSMAEISVGALSRTSTIRLFNVFGRNEHHKGDMASMPYKITQSYLKAKRYDLHSEDCFRDFIDVETASEIFVQEASTLMQYQSSVQRRWDAGSGNPISFRQLDSMISSKFNSTGSLANSISRPQSLQGRYQVMTKAGLRCEKHPLLSGYDLGERLSSLVYDVQSDFQKDNS